MLYFGGALILQLHRFIRNYADGIQKLDARVVIKRGQEVAVPVVAVWFFEWMEIYDLQ